MRSTARWSSTRTWTAELTPRRSTFHTTKINTAFTGGPVILPHYNGKDKMWFSGYWEGFRSTQTQSYSAESVPTAAGEEREISPPSWGRKWARTAWAGRNTKMRSTIFATSRADPSNSGRRHSRPIPEQRDSDEPHQPVRPRSSGINITWGCRTSMSLRAFFRITTSGTTSIDSDIMGVQIINSASMTSCLAGITGRTRIAWFLKTPGYFNTLNNYIRSIALGYTHIFSSSTILNFRYGWLSNLILTTDTPAGAAFANSFNFNYGLNPSGLPMSYGPGLSISRLRRSVANLAGLGPSRGQGLPRRSSKVVGHPRLARALCGITCIPTTPPVTPTRLPTRKMPLPRERQPAPRVTGRPASCSGLPIISAPTRETSVKT